MSRSRAQRFGAQANDALRCLAENALCRPLRLVDVGARGTPFSDLTSIAPFIDVTGFEPDEAEIPRIIRSAKQNGWRSCCVHPIALGADDGSATLYRTRRGDLSSLLTPATTAGADWRVASEATVTVASLRSLVRRSLVSEVVDILKIDVQGTELDVLRGAGDLLDNTVHVEVECRFLDHYRGQSSYATVAKYLEDRGFQLYGIRQVYEGGALADSQNSIELTRRRLSHADLTFSRGSEWVASAPSSDAPRDRAGRLVTVLAALGYWQAAVAIAAEFAPELADLLEDARPRAARRASWVASVLVSALKCVGRPTSANRIELARTALEVDEPGTSRFRILPPRL